MSNRYFIETPLEAGEYQLDGPEGHHLANVMRCKQGDVVTLFCGDGREAKATVLESGKRDVRLEVATPKPVDREPRIHLHIGCAFPKGDRADFLIEKLTELGVAELTPLISERGVVKIGADKLPKLRRQVIEACKQCGRNRLMEIHPARKFDDWLGTKAESRFVLHPGGHSWSGERKMLRDTAAVTIGPEGGLSSEEVAKAWNGGWTPLGLGKAILRIESAAMAIAALVSLDDGK